LFSSLLDDAGWDSTASMGAIFGLAGLVCVPVLLTTDTSWLGTPGGVATVAWLGLVTTTLAYVLFSCGLVHLTAPTVTTLTLAKPLTATVLGLVVLGERLSATTLVGLVVLAAGLVVLAADARRAAGRPVPA